MQKIINLNHKDILHSAQELSIQVKKDFSEKGIVNIYPIPRGGVPCAYILLQFLPLNFYLTDDINAADIIIDDIEDSSTTRKNMLQLNPKAKFYSLYNSKDYNCWLSFPWERTLENKDESISQELLRISEYLKLDIDTIKMKLGINT